MQYCVSDFGLRSREIRAKRLRKNNLVFWHLIFTPSSAASQSRNPQRRPGYACGFAQSFSAKSGANLSANSTKLFLRRP